MPSIGPKGTPIIHALALCIFVYMVSHHILYTKKHPQQIKVTIIYTILVMLQLSLILEWHYIMHVPYYYMHVFYMGIQIQTIKFDFMGTGLYIYRTLYNLHSHYIITLRLH